MRISSTPLIAEFWPLIRKTIPSAARREKCDRDEDTGCVVEGVGEKRKKQCSAGSVGATGKDVEVR
jgi:hypothetical protein